jgi:hypothetical protein
MPTTTCPHCHRSIPFEMHEAQTVFQCAQWGGKFTPLGGAVGDGKPATEAAARTFRFPCPHCQQSIKANGDQVGKRLACPKCRQPILVPSDTGPQPAPVPPKPEPLFQGATHASAAEVSPPIQAVGAVSAPWATMIPDPEPVPHGAAAVPPAGPAHWKPQVPAGTSCDAGTQQRPAKGVRIVWDLCLGVVALVTLNYGWPLLTAREISAVQQAALAGMGCFWIILAYVVARSLEAILGAGRR